MKVAARGIVISQRKKDVDWTSPADRREYFRNLEAKLDIKNLSDWYNVRQNQLGASGRYIIMKYHDDGLPGALRDLHPDHIWDPTRFPRAPRGHWADPAVLRQMFEQQAPTFKVQRLEDWYKVQTTDLYRKVGSRPFRRCGSFPSALAYAYPNHEWKPWLFTTVPYGLWDSEIEGKAYIRSLIPKSELDKWYDVTKSDKTIWTEHLRIILKRHFNQKLLTGLTATFPEHKWHEWRFKIDAITTLYWHENPSATRECVDWIGQQFNVKQPSDWGNVSLEAFKALPGGASLVKAFDTLSVILTKAYPDTNEWYKYTFKDQRLDLTSESERKAFVKRIELQLGVTKPDDWYNVSADSIAKCGGRNLLDYYFQTSIPKVARWMYPEHEWDEWKFIRTSTKYWDSIENQRSYFDALAQTLKITDRKQWYDQAVNVLHKHGGGGLLLSKYQGSLFKALSAVYPEHSWQKWLFSVNRGFWDSLDTQQQYFQWITQELGINTLDEWYEIEAHEIRSRGGYTLLQKYKHSLPRALMATYPFHKWQMWRFKAVPARWWDNMTNQREYMDWVKQELNIADMGKWHAVTALQLKAVGASALLKRYNGSPKRLLEAVYADHDWQSWKFSRLPAKK